MAEVQFDPGKMRAVILHTCHACDPSDLGAVKLHKVLYYLDMVMYAHQREVVTGATYRKRPNGPMADQLLFTLRDMTQAGDLKVENVNYHGFWKKEYQALVPEPEGILNSEELSMLDDVIDFVCRKNTAKSISDYSHALPWEMADMGGEIPYHTAMLLFPMQPSPEAFDAAEQGMSEVETARSQTEALGLQDLGAFRGRVLASVGQR
tara:strand:- start:839 stop:1459 length:621 start_codon:yes stop_codon:yes gene_type:complete